MTTEFVATTEYGTDSGVHEQTKGGKGKGIAPDTPMAAYETVHGSDTALELRGLNASYS